MPRGVKATKTSKTTKKMDIDEYSDDESIVDIPLETTVKKKSKVLINSTSKTSTERTKLAQAINNFNIKSEQLIQEMKNFDNFKEIIASLDLEMETKKQEHDELLNKLDQEYKMKIKEVNDNYNIKTKELEEIHKDKKKELNNLLEDNKIDVQRKINEDKDKYCQQYAKELKMLYLKENDHKNLLSELKKSTDNYEDLKKNFDKKCETNKNEECKKYQEMLKNDKERMDLTNKATHASLTAQLEQQKNEIKVLTKTIDDLKHELKEQRELTKDIANSASKSQINQTIGGKN